jgi:hypothetical protein
MTQDQQLAHLRQQVDKFYTPPGAPMAKANPPSETGKVPQISGEEFMAKALVSVGKRHLTTAQLTEAELCINAGKRPPEPIVRCVIDGVAYSPWG